MLTSTQKKIVLEWETCSRWNDSHMDDLYTRSIRLKERSNEYEFDYDHEIEFFVYRCHLILRSTLFYCNDTKSVTYYDLGEFVDTLDKGQGCNKIKQYAQYVLDGYMENQDLLHCPSFEPLHDMDENFNPLTDEAMNRWG